MIRDIRIGLRSALAFGVIGVITFALGVFSIIQLSTLNTVTDVLTLHRIPAITTVEELRAGSLQIRALVSDLSDSKTAEDVRAIQAEIETLQVSYAKNSEDMAALVRSDEAKEMFKEITSLDKKFNATLAELYQLTAQQQGDKAVEYRRTVVVPALNNLLDNLHKLAAYQVQRANVTNDEATQTYLNSRASLSSGIVITLGLVGLLAFLYSRSLLLPLRQAVALAKQIADGNLTNSFDDQHQDEAAEMLRSLADMQKNLRQTLAMISASSQQLATTSEELSVVTNQSTQVITQQSDQLEQAATAVNEMTVAIEEVARSANATSDNTEKADEKTQQGQAKITETIQTIEFLTNEIGQSADGVLKLANNIKQIGSVLDVIRAIADQTNLLALNAAIEAARAGESGRGFAVVADEVRALAHRTQESTKEIERMIQTVQAETNTAVQNMSSSNERAATTLAIANDAGVSFSEITLLISQINDQNLTIASAAEEQATVAREVDKNLLFIRDLAIQTAAGANQTNASSNELAGLAEQLNALVLKFKL